MISIDYVQTFARYNKWQNDGLIAQCAPLSRDVLTADRGAFFGSIQGTLNHLLWGDRIWMHRLDNWPRPEGGIPESPDLYPTFAAWRADRERADLRLITWADSLRPAQIRGTLTFVSAALGKQTSRPIALCIMHMFNHQTHHRGQIHGMLTAAGLSPQASDLFVMPGLPVD